MVEWFSADKEGLSKLVQRRGMAWLLYEVVQNGMDQEVTQVNVTLDPIPNAPQVILVCEDDDPQGFEKLSHAWTLFSDTSKRSDPTKAGRFTIGEKLVLSMAYEAKIETTTGTVVFDSDGRHVLKSKREKGSRIEVRLPMTRAEFTEVCEAAKKLIPRSGVTLTFNDEVLAHRSPVTTFEADLPTEFADENRVLRRSKRKTKVSVFDTLPGAVPMLYELGIPVVELEGGERWDVYVHQRIPLNAERDNVTPAYLQTIRVHLANAVREHLTKEDATKTWVSAAIEDERVDPAVVQTALEGRFGKKRAIYDPNDPEANKALMNEGYTIVPGGALPKGSWDNVKKWGLAAPSGKIKPSGIQYNFGGRPERVIAPENYTENQRFKVEYARDLAWKLIAKDIDIRIVSEPTERHAAWFGQSTLTLNLGCLGKVWFDRELSREHNELLLHEFSHAAVHDHLTREFSDEVGRLGAKLGELMYSDPGFFKAHGYTPK